MKTIVLNPKPKYKEITGFRGQGQTGRVPGAHFPYSFVLDSPFRIPLCSPLKGLCIHVYIRPSDKPFKGPFIPYIHTPFKGPYISPFLWTQTLNPTSRMYPLKRLP